MAVILSGKRYVMLSLLNNLCSLLDHWQPGWRHSDGMARPCSPAKWVSGSTCGGARALANGEPSCDHG